MIDQQTLDFILSTHKLIINVCGEFVELLNCQSCELLSGCCARIWRCYSAWD